MKRTQRDSSDSATSYLVHLDGARCDGHGICVLRLPQRITLDEWGYAVIDPVPIDTELDLQRARRAIRACPAGALELVAVHHGPAPLRQLRPPVRDSISRN